MHTARKRLFLACKEINGLGITKPIRFHGIAAKDVVPDFLEAMENIDDDRRIDDLSDMAIDLYELIVDDKDEEIRALNDDEKPLYDKKRKGRKRKYQNLIERNDPDVYDRQAERRKVIQRPLGRKLDI